MNKIDFEITEIDDLIDDPGNKKYIVRIFIDGNDLRRVVYDAESEDRKDSGHQIKFEDSYEGIAVCLYNNCQNFSNIPQKKTMVLGCTCLEPGCNPVFTDICEENGKIIWNITGTLYNKVDYSGLVFTFNKEEYLQKVRALEKAILEKVKQFY